MRENKMYEATKNLMGKLDKIIDWCETTPVEDKEEEFIIDWIQTNLDELKELSLFYLKVTDKGK
jgi:hypothetical protein